MNWIKRLGATSVLLGVLALPALAETFEGTIAQVQSNHFTLINNRNQVLRVMLKPGDHFPSTLVAGAKVRVEADQDNMKQWVLESIEQVEGLVLPQNPPR